MLASGSRGGYVAGSKPRAGGGVLGVWVIVGGVEWFLREGCSVWVGWWGC